MKTTVVLAEHLVVGLMVMALGAWGAEALAGMRMLSVLNEANASAWVVLLFLAYALGVVWSRAADAAMSPIDKALKRKFYPGLEDTGSTNAYHLSLLNVHAKHDGLAESMVQVRSEYRISRALALTGLFWTLVALVAVRGDYGNTTGPTNWLMVALGIAFMVGGVATYAHLRGHYLRWAALYSAHFNGDKAPPSAPGHDQ